MEADAGFLSSVQYRGTHNGCQGSDFRNPALGAARALKTVHDRIRHVRLAIASARNEDVRFPEWAAMVAERTGREVDASTVQRWEKRTRPDDATLEAIASLGAVRIAWLVYGEEPKYPPSNHDGEPDQMRAMTTEPTVGREAQTPKKRPKRA